MSRNSSSNSSSTGKGGNQLISGILIGMVVGVSLAAGIAWFLKNAPSPFVKKEKAAVIAPAETVPRAPSVKPASGMNNDKPRFEFYKVLTDKQDATVLVPEKPKAADSKPAVAFEPQVLQAGSFSNETDAENLKAKLALLGMEAGVQAATIPDKGVWYRVRLGPYKTAAELNDARNFLKQNGVDSTPIRAQ